MKLDKEMVTGFLTAYNRWAGDVPERDIIYRTTDATGCSLVTDGYCGAHPLVPLAMAVESLVMMLKP